MTSAPAPSSFSVAEITEPSGPAFDEAYGALHDEFGVRNELELPRVIESWIEGDHAHAWRTNAGFALRYHLLVARDANGAFAGVRDCHVVIDEARRIAVTLLSHVLVMPPYRQSGLGARLRQEALSRTERDLRARHIDPAQAEILLAAEMEPASYDDDASLVRLVAYRRAGFKVIAPHVLPYAQPDYRDPGVIGDSPAPVPLLAVVRRVGREHESVIPAALARAYPVHIYAACGTHCLERHIGPTRARMLAAIDAAGLDPVPLLPLPESKTDHDALAPLLRDRVLSYHLHR